MARLGSVTMAIVAVVVLVGGLLAIGAASGDGVSLSPPPSDGTTVVDSMVSDAGVTDTTTTSTTTTTIGTTTSSTLPRDPVVPFPLSVSPTMVRVGPGGMATLSGTCPIVGGAALGPVEIWEVGASITHVATGVAAASWTYDWQAPAEPGPLVLQVWCGDPSGFTGGYPEALQIAVVFVQQAVATTVAVSPPDADGLPGTA